MKLDALISSTLKPIEEVKVQLRSAEDDLGYLKQ